MTTTVRSKLAAATALGLLLIGPPALLWTLVGWPLPSVPALREAVDLRWVSPTLAQQLGATVAWAAWLYIAACIGTSILRQALHTTVALPLPHSLAGWINATVALLLIGSSVTGRHASAPVVSAPVATIAYQATTVAQAATPAVQTRYDVQPRDTLWDIAEQHLGNPLRWREIWQLNAHQTMADGTTFTDPNLIRPGWQLTLPHSTDRPAAAARPVHHDAPVLQRPEAPPHMQAELPPRVGLPATEPAPSIGPELASPATRESRTAGEHDAALPVGLGLGAAAAGVVALLARRRRRAMLKRPTGLRLPLPTGELAAAEHALRNRANLDGADAIAGTLRLAAALTPAETAPLLELLIDAPDGIELQFSGAIQLPEPFIATDGGYRLPREHVPATYAAADRPDPAPALVHLGHDDRGGIYLNLEALGAVALDGEPSVVQELVGRVLTSLSGSPWTALTEVRVTDEDHADGDVLGEAQLVALTDELPRLSAVASHTTSEVSRAGSDSLPRLRWAQSEAPDGVSVVVARPDQEHIAELLTLSQDRRTAVVALLTGPHPDVATIKLTQDAMLLPDHTAITAPAPSPASQDAVRELIALADAPCIDVTDEPYAEVREHAPASDADAEIVVRVLGPLDIDGPIPHLPPQLKDIVLYLALHRRGVSIGDMSTALWPEALRSEKTLRNRMHELRRSLGGRISLGPGWRVDDSITTDWAQFQAWSQGSLDDRQRALGLVRGQPLSDIKGEWASMEGFEAEMEAAIVDLAIDVSQQLLLHGDPTAARAAVRSGLRACPWDERLHQLGMRAAAQRGSVSEVKALYNELRAILIEDEAEPDPDTEATYREMLELARRESRLGSPETVGGRS